MEEQVKIIELPIEYVFNGQPNFIFPSLVVVEDELTFKEYHYYSL